MTGQSRHATRAIRRELDEHQEDVDSVVLRDAIHDADDGAPEALQYLAETVANARHAAGCTERPKRQSPVFDAVDAAWGNARDALELYVEELIAGEFQTVLEDAAYWSNRDDGELRAAREEAREWLQRHHEAAERAGVFDAMEARA